MNAHERRVARRAHARALERTRAMLAAAFPGLRLSGAMRMQWQGSVTRRFSAGPPPRDNLPK